MTSKESSKEKIEFAGTVSPQEAAQYLESIAKGLRERSMLLESGNTSLTVEVADEVKIEISAASDADKGKAAVELGLSWRTKRDNESAPPPGLLIIAGATPSEAPAFAE
jgi:amphi-Trp domain-containing protein